MLSGNAYPSLVHTLKIVSAVRVLFAAVARVLSAFVVFAVVVREAFLAC